MREKIIIDTTENKRIYGELDYTDDSSDSLLIFIHGFTGSKTQYTYLYSVPFFNSRGIATFRYNCYGREADTRKTSDITFQNQIDDFNNLIDYFRDKYKKLYVVGHSFGSIVSSFSNNEKLDKLVFWDPTMGFPSAKDKGFIINNVLDAYICDVRTVSIFSKDYIDSWQKLTVKDQLDKVRTSIRIFFAEKSTKYIDWKGDLVGKYSDIFEIVPNADHDFLVPGTADELYKRTYNWLIQ